MIRWLDSQWTSTIQGPKSQKVHRFPGTFFGPWGFTFFQTCSKVLNSSHWLPIPNTTNDFHMTGGWGSRHLEGMYFAKPLLFHGSNFPAKTTPCLSWRKKTNSEQKNYRCPYRAFSHVFNIQLQPFLPLKITGWFRWNFQNWDPLPIFRGKNAVCYFREGKIQVQLQHPQRILALSLVSPDDNMVLLEPWPPLGKWKVVGTIWCT